MIEKIQKDPHNFRVKMLYYQSARDAMYDAVDQLVRNKGYSDIFIPGYIGLSPKEGSGIFDPLNKIQSLKRHYYRMTKKLEIDVDSLEDALSDKSILLIVNYFGFRDKNIERVIEIAKKHDCVIIEDNAHGFYTYFCNAPLSTDITFFSFHKMLPFSSGGGLLILNDGLDLDLDKNRHGFIGLEPFAYDINGIARKRKENYRFLMELVRGHEDCFFPLKDLDDIIMDVPQTFPLIIVRGDRDEIYSMLNDEGYGVVSLYHTMIDELQVETHEEAIWLSKHILNLPVHQDCDTSEYPKMVGALVKACSST